MLTVAVTIPAAVGSKMIEKVCVPPRRSTTASEGCSEMVKAVLPLRLTIGRSVRLRGAVPGFVIVKVRVSVSPTVGTISKSV